MAEPIVVWRFMDGKSGHENQTAGLLAALRDRAPVDDYQLQAASCRPSLVSFISGRIPFGRDLPAPDLIVGAGHATHLPMLAARRARGGRVIVLMKPSLPCAWFDGCVIPEHDGPRRKGNILVTRGALNRVRYSKDKNPDEGLFLVGGPSAHVNWSSESVAGQISRIIQRSPDMHWRLATSRRTPVDFAGVLGALPAESLTIVPFGQTTPDWLPAQLASAGRVWVSEDSVSMIYEALTSGAVVGLLSVTYRKKSDRLAQGIKVLLQEALVTGFDSWQQGAELHRPGVPFDEAGRCSDWILEQWQRTG
jgi:mitochondrial fission protein ELM1